jgi:hypothetical protein
MAVNESQFQFSVKILLLPQNTYLNSYLQSEKYFNDIDTVIRKDFTLKTLAVDNAMTLEKLNLPNSISHHVRRGDYVSNPLINSFLGVCPVQYYECAVKIITERIRNPQFFIFSDDTEWVKQNLKLDFPVSYQDINNKPYYDLYRMSQCSHNIIANSSFSWWAAWHNDNPEKIVFAPQNWFADKRIDCSDRLYLINGLKYE